MTPVAERSSAPRRRRDAQESRRALLAAASALFDERGYESATVREIGERAGVDPALIARYFGGKEGLFLATLEQGDGRSLPADPALALAAILHGSAHHGVGPIALSMLRPGASDSLRAQTADIVRTRVIEPLAAELAARGVPDARLRAEALYAVALGVSLTRASGMLPALTAATVDQLTELLEPVAAALSRG
jgi:AcrR family transcriptional regulator